MYDLYTQSIQASPSLKIIFSTVMAFDTLFSALSYVVGTHKICIYEI